MSRKINIKPDYQGNDQPPEKPDIPEGIKKRKGIDDRILDNPVDDRILPNPIDDRWLDSSIDDRWV